MNRKSTVPESWEGDGTTEIAPDDSEWGGDAPARKNNLRRRRRARRCLPNWRAARSRRTDLPAPPGAGAAPERGGPRGAALPDRVAQRRRLPGRLPRRPLADRRPGREPTWSRPRNWSTASAWRWACCSRWNPPAWARATWANACACSSRRGWPTRRAITAPPRHCAFAQQPMELLAQARHQAPDAPPPVQRRPSRRAGRASALIARLEPKPGRRFRRCRAQRGGARRDRHARLSGGGQPRFKVHAQRRCDAAPARARHLRQRHARPWPWQGRRSRPRRTAAAPAGGALVHQEHPAALRHHPARVHAPSSSARSSFFRAR
jgi:hypothetical protein